MTLTRLNAAVIGTIRQATQGPDRMGPIEAINNPYPHNTQKEKTALDRLS